MHFKGQRRSEQEDIVNNKFETTPRKGGYTVSDARDKNRVAIALILDGGNQQHAEIVRHLCTLESGDHVTCFSSIGSCRKVHQDRLLVYPDQSLVVLPDGYGEYGDLFANVTILHALEHPSDSFLRMASELQTSFISEGSNLQQTFTPSGKKIQKGGVACGFLRIEKNVDGKKKLNYLRLGDVNIVVVREGIIVLRTIDQTEEQLLLCQGEDPKKASEKSNVIVNAISSEHENEHTEEPQNFDLEPHDIVLIGCDGVMKERTNKEIEEAVTNNTREIISIWLKEKGYEGTDNITAAVIEIT